MTYFNAGQPFLTRHATDLGLPLSDLRDALRTGTVRRLLRGVLVDARVPDSRELRVAALALLIPADATVASHSAAWAFGADTRPPSLRHDLRPQVLVRHSGTRLKGDRFIVRQTTIPDADAVTIGGVRFTSPVRTTSDLLRFSWRPHALAAGDAMLRAEATTSAEVGEYVSRFSRLPWIRQAQELAPHLNGKADRHGESWTRCRLLDAGLPTPSLNVPVVLDGVTYWLDMAYEEQLLSIEYDGREHHEGDANEKHDGARRAGIHRRLGWRFEIANFENVFGVDPALEAGIGSKLGLTIRARTW